MHALKICVFLFIWFFFIVTNFQIWVYSGGGSVFVYLKLKSLSEVGPKHTTNVAGLQACNFIRKIFQHWCFPTKFAKFLRTPIFYLRKTASICFTSKYYNWRPATLLKKTTIQVFSCEVREIFRSTFFYRIPLVTASAPSVAASVFLKK